MSDSLDTERLEDEVKSVYRDVAERPDGEFHFEMGRGLAERLGYDADLLDEVPETALESFAGVGYHVDLVDLREGDSVLDLGSGSATDVFYVALRVGESGGVTGVDMTDEQLDKARRIRDDAGFDGVSFEKAYIEEVPFDEGSFDVVVSNGVINLSPDKPGVFAEARRVLRPGGRLALSDIVSERPMPDSIKTDADLWAACIGGAMQVDDYLDLLEGSGFEVVELRDNTEYEFVSESAANACEKYGIKSVSLAAERT